MQDLLESEKRAEAAARGRQCFWCPTGKENDARTHVGRTRFQCFCLGHGEATGKAIASPKSIEQISCKFQRAVIESANIAW